MSDWQDLTCRYGYRDVDEAVGDIRSLTDSTALGAMQRFQRYLARIGFAGDIVNPNSQAPGAALTITSVAIKKAEEHEIGCGMWCLCIVREAKFNAG